jgi:hypothetical protein
LAINAISAAPSGVLIVHDELAPMQVLAEGLRERGYDTRLLDEAAFAAAVGSYTPAAVFMYVHAVIDPVVERRLIDYAEAGGRLVILHHGLASAKTRNEHWLPFLGVKIFPRDDPRFPWKVLRGRFEFVNLRPGHYITTHRVEYPRRTSYEPSDAPSAPQDLPAIEFPDTEVFLNHVFTDARRKTVLFGFRIEAEGRIHVQDRAGWMMPAGKGHVFYFQPGHLAGDFREPRYVQILVNCIEWRP